MNNEIPIKSGSCEYRAFLQNGFYMPEAAPTNRLHIHNYAEIHLVVGGSAEFAVCEKTYIIENAGMMIVPQNTFHCCKHMDDDARHTAFQISRTVTDTKIKNIPFDMISSFISEVQNRNYTQISAYIALFCGYFDLTKEITAKPITDYGFLIREFISTNYSRDLRLLHLAASLHLSERQTERLVIKHTGMTFKRALAETRINMAKILIKSEKMTLDEISRYVGYHSYSGFWKAMRQSGYDF